MKYIEELKFGRCFMLNNIPFILTTDFKSNGKKQCINLMDGTAHWLSGSDMVDDIDIYTMDKDNTLIPIKERENEYKHNTIES